jgi:RimJ/RimL family protein N-acetyltransferase
LIFSPRFLIDPANHRSQRAVEKIGTTGAGLRTDASGRRSCVFQIATREWLTTNSKGVT